MTPLLLLGFVSALGSALWHLHNFFWGSTSDDWARIDRYVSRHGGRMAELHRAGVLILYNIRVFEIRVVEQDGSSTIRKVGLQDRRQMIPRLWLIDTNGLLQLASSWPAFD